MLSIIRESVQWGAIRRRENGQEFYDECSLTGKVKNVWAQILFDEKSNIEWALKNPVVRVSMIKVTQFENGMWDLLELKLKTKKALERVERKKARQPEKVQVETEEIDDTELEGAGYDLAVSQMDPYING